MHQALKRVSILLVEPDEGLALEIQQMLLGHFPASPHLTSARDLEQGVAVLCSHQVELIVLNLASSDYKGLPAVRALRQLAPASALITVSTVADDALLMGAIRDGAHEALLWPPPSAPDLHSAMGRAMIRAVLHQDERTLALSKLAHDLNNAMTSINGFADILLARLPADDPARRSAEQIKRAGTRAAALVKSLASPIERTPEPLIVDPAA